MNKLSQEVKEYVGKIHSCIKYWLNKLHPHVGNVLQHLQINAQYNAQEQGLDDFISGLAAHNDHVALSSVRESFHRAGSRNYDPTKPPAQTDVDFIEQIFDIVFKDNDGTVTKQPLNGARNIAQRLSEAKKEWLEIDLFLCFALLYIKGVSPTHIELLLQCCRALSYRDDCVSILRNAPEVSELMVIIGQEASNDPTYISRVECDEYDTVKNRSGGIGDGTRLEGGGFDVAFSDDFRHFEKKFTCKREMQYQQYLNKKRDYKDHFYQQIDPETASTNWHDSIAAKAPFYRQYGMIIPHYNKLNSSFPHLFAPGLIVSYTPDASNIPSTTIENNNNNVDIDVTTASNHDNACSTCFIFVTMTHQHYFNVSKQDIITKQMINNVTIDASKSQMSKDEWKAINNVGPSSFNHPRLYGIPLQHTGTDKLVSKLLPDGTVQFVEWDLVELSKNNTFRIHHTVLKNLMFTKALIYTNYDHLCDKMEFSHFVTFDKNNNLDLLHGFPDIVEIRDPLRFFADPVLYPHPKEIKCCWIAKFVDGIHTQHSSALAPGITMLQTRMLNGDTSDIINTGMTFHNRGLSSILTAQARIIHSVSCIGRIIQYYDLSKDALCWGYEFGGLMMMIMDRPELSNVTFKTGSGGVNPGPKRIGMFENRMPYNHWKNDHWNYAADFHKSQRFIDSVRHFVETFQIQFSKQFQEQLLSSVGASNQLLLQSSRMPGIALGDLHNAEPSHLALGGMLKCVNKFLITMLERKNSVRFHILSLAYNHTCSITDPSHCDSVPLIACRNNKSAWKFHQNYHANLKLLLTVDRFLSEIDQSFIDLIISSKKLLCVLAWSWCSTFSNSLRVLSEEWFHDFMTTWYNSKCDPNMVYDENGNIVFVTDDVEMNDSDNHQTLNKNKSKRTKQKTLTSNKANSIKDFSKLQKYIQDNKNVINIDESDIIGWNQHMLQEESKIKTAAQIKKNQKRGRENIKRSTDFTNAHAAISAPNFQYFREYFLDAYICGSAPSLSSMIFESSMKDNKKAAQADSWKKIGSMIPRVFGKLKTKTKFHALLAKSLNYDDHDPKVMKMLNASVQRS